MRPACLGLSGLNKVQLSVESECEPTTDQMTNPMSLPASWEVL